MAGPAATSAPGQHVSVQRVKVSLSGTPLQFPGQRCYDPHERDPRLGYRFDLEDDFAGVEPDNKRLLAALWMVRQRRVHEPSAVRLVHDRLDPARGHDPQTELASPDSDGRASEQFRSNREHLDSRTPVSGPHLQAF